MLRPVFGTNTAMRRTGQACRIRDWKSAGLLTLSVVGGDELLMPASAITIRIVARSPTSTAGSWSTENTVRARCRGSFARKAKHGRRDHD